MGGKLFSAVIFNLDYIFFNWYDLFYLIGVKFIPAVMQILLPAMTGDFRCSWFKLPEIQC